MLYGAAVESGRVATHLDAAPRPGADSLKVGQREDHPRLQSKPSTARREVHNQ